jgi:SAM-dependent methyltransferase
VTLGATATKAAGVDAALRQQTLARFAVHRRAWQNNPALRALYASWYARVRAELPPRELGPWVELGSGPGLAAELIPELELTDVVQAPWHAREVAAEALPWPAETLGALVLFDVLHHLPRPAAFFAEAVRVLRPGGRVVLCEPYVSPLSRVVYRLFHEERLDFAADPLGDARARGADPFDGNQAVPTALFFRQRAAFERRFPALRVRRLERLAGLAYPASGGFSQAPLLPLPLWRRCFALERRLPAAAFRLIGFRLLAVLERVGATASAG